MLARRPFGSREGLLGAGRDEWFALDPADWVEAFGQHPRIGDRDSLARQFGETRHLAAKEQAGVAGASAPVLDALARGNAEYEARFGFIFIVCATGRSAEEMLDLLNARMVNPPEVEVRVAAGEQARITALRLAQLQSDSTVEDRDS